MTGNAQFRKETDEKGAFKRQTSAFRRVVEASPEAEFPAESGRYHLYVSYACPWAHRTIIYRKLKGLEKAISLNVVDPFRDEKGWRFTPDKDGCDADEINSFSYLREAYEKSDPKFDQRVTVPVLWDKRTSTIVNNESSEVIRILNSSFNEFAENPELDLYPEEHRSAINDWNERIYEFVNNGVYKAGFASTQEAYEAAVLPLFEMMDELDSHLAHSRFILGDAPLEVDWRLVPTLIRFDPVYVVHFKCNIRRLLDYKHLTRYLKDLMEVPGVRETVNFSHIKEHYFATHEKLNPNRIIPVGPTDFVN